MIFFSALVLIFILVTIFVFRLPRFGKRPYGKRLERIKASPNYKNGSFQNESYTPGITENTSMFKVLKEFFFDKKERRKPKALIPSVKTNLHNIDINKNVLVWFGHSSYYMQLDGKRILVDPVFCGHASPFSFSVKAFAGAEVCAAVDLPEIDLLFITHDHWDHLDYATVKRIQPKVKQVITGLGTGSHLERWGYDDNIITEMDWNEDVSPLPGFIISSIPARHFSGRGFIRNKTLWLSFVLQSPTKKIFIGGDSGYDKHFAETGRKFGPLDLAIIENGQYNESWKYIHMLPEEVVKAAKELNAKRIIPVHSGKFALALHAWDEPLNLITENEEAYHLNIITPMIGEVVDLDNESQDFSKWWEGID
ncbi:MBL fold metallo-hydrolase [Parafilimonas terrae]|uniref:L-ascorbate metabolism protein UlaG, beta-lactamase superfamily n=1 Tax=Parafilimonas terrae TaxID=1465490 RepID=A0A1I5YNJ4_9BACT|nr:MBL fold metallo-hydrolase [Parafilimonas terrae]SFQ45819.1 L-ascorbate metabolism protein UlaG, beta-lactamase superfamily [Parafilimonas terrae]